MPTRKQYSPHRAAVARKRATVSQAWRKMRANHLLLYPECRICEDPQDVHVHHLRYRGKRGESELPGDLVTLCQFHHNEFHRIYGTAGKHKGSLPDNTLRYIKEKREQQFL